MDCRAIFIQFIHSLSTYRSKCMAVNAKLHDIHSFIDLLL
jgi:hypothetical protein